MMAALCTTLCLAGLAAGEGIAARYPLDAGIEGHPNVIFASGFERGLSGWTKHRAPGIHDILKDPKTAHSGGACLQSTANRGKDTGGDCLYTLPRTVEKIHLRFYCRFHKDTCMPHHFVKIRANPTDYWGGGAGYRPPGDKAFWTGIEPTKDRTWLFYTYWHKMRSWDNPDGTPRNPPKGTGRSFFGNTFHPDDQTPFRMDEWVCVEAMMKCNAVGRSDGEKAFWIDGNKIGHWRPGEPDGSWIRDKFVTSGFFNKDPKPFEGFEFRTSPEVRISAVALQWYVSERVSGGAKTDRNICYFDDVVVATDYIGPMVRARTTAASKGSEGVWALVAEKEKARREKAESGGGPAEAAKLARAGDYEAAAAAYEELASRGGKDAERFSALAHALRRAGELRGWIIAGVSAGREAKTYVDVMGVRLRGKVVAADEGGLTVACMGNEVGLKWEEIPPARLFSVARRYAASDEQAALLRELREACGMEEK